MTPAELLEAVTPWLWKLANRYAPRYKLDPDDAFQHTALAILTAAPKYDPARSKATTWASWQFRGALARLVVERERAGRARLTGDEILSAHPDGRTEDAEDVPYSDHLPAALDALPSRQRAVVEQHHGIGTPEDTMTEIGQRLGVSRQRVFQLHSQAVAKLRRLLLDLAHPRAPAA